MTVEMDTEKTNHAIRDNTMEKILDSALSALKPEAVYFGAKNGKRTGYIVFDLADPSDIPTACEPFFQDLDAKIELIPVMDVASVQSGLRKYAAQ